MPIVAISSEDVEFTLTIHTSLLEAEDDNTIDLDLNANAQAIPAHLVKWGQVHLKRWKDPDKTEALRITDKEELETVMCRSIMISRANNNSTGERCTSEKRNDPGPSESGAGDIVLQLVPWCTCAIDTEAEYPFVLRREHK